MWESMNSLWSAVQSGVNLVYHAAGWLEGGLIASYEKFVMDCEVLQQIQRYFEPVLTDTSPDALAIEAIAEVGAHGHFFGAEHTQSRYTSAFYAPFLSDWRNYEAWAEAGAPTTEQRANRIWKAILAEFSRRRWTRRSATSSPTSSPAASARAVRRRTFDPAVCCRHVASRPEFAAVRGRALTSRAARRLVPETGGVVIHATLDFPSGRGRSRRSWLASPMAASAQVADWTQGWSGQATLYAWLPTINGSQEGPDGQPLIDLSSADVLSALDMAFMGVGDLSEGQVRHPARCRLCRPQHRRHLGAEPGQDRRRRPRSASTPPPPCTGSTSRTARSSTSTAACATSTPSPTSSSAPPTSARPTSPRSSTGPTASSASAAACRSASAARCRLRRRRRLRRQLRPQLGGLRRRQLRVLRPLAGHARLPLRVDPEVGDRARLARHRHPGAAARDHLQVLTVTRRRQAAWWVMTDSNRRHPRCKRGALPTELITRGCLIPRAGPRDKRGLAGLISRLRRSRSPRNRG